ncbi:sensor histidine kinase [Gordonia rhizosphera]|nr:HAMP domain-containing sensor histidine kinase [Gordonia rhizosphera]
MVRSRGSMRMQATIIAAVVVTVALLVGGAAMLYMLRSANNEAMYQSTQREAHQVAATIDRDGIGGLSRDDLMPGAGADIIQVIDSGGQVVARSPGVPTSPVVEGNQPPQVYRYFDGVVVPGVDGEFCATAVGAEHDGAYYTVVALQRSSGLRHSELVTATILLAEIPILVLVAAGAVYLLVGRSLRPVSRITHQVNDITAKDLERRVPVPEADDEIHTLATTMNGMLARLENSREAQLRFVADASHELRSPLTTVVGILGLADDTDSEVDLDTVRTILLPEATRMQVMVDDLLTLARADENGLQLHAEEIDLDDIVTAEVARVRSLGAARIRAHVTPIRLVGDGDKIARAVRNVIDNAVRHARSMVSVTMRTDHGFASVTVADDGPGIPPEDRALVFRRFARIDVDRRNQFGAGLGLAIVAEIVHAHGGTVEVGEAATGGAAVTIRVPLSAPAAAPERPREAESELSDMAVTPGRSTTRGRGNPDPQTSQSR